MRVAGAKRGKACVFESLLIGQESGKRFFLSNHKVAACRQNNRETIREERTLTTKDCKGPQTNMPQELRREVDN